MNNLKQILVLLTGGLLTLNTFAAETTNRPIHVLYLGPVEAGRSGPRGGGFGGGGSRTNYVHLPGQTLAPEAIYLDHLTTLTNLTDAYLKHFDVAVQVMPDGDISAAQRRMLDSFKSAGNALLEYTERPSDAVLREAVLSGVSKKARSAWEALLASRPPLQRLPGARYLSRDIGALGIGNADKLHVGEVGARRCIFLPVDLTNSAGEITKNRLAFGRQIDRAEITRREPKVRAVRTLIQRASAHDGIRHSAGQVEDGAQLPVFDEPRDQSGTVPEKVFVRTDRQRQRAVAAQIERAVLELQSVVFATFVHRVEAD